MTAIQMHDVLSHAADNDGRGDFTVSGMNAADEHDAASREKELLEAGIGEVRSVESLPSVAKTDGSKLVGRAKYAHDLQNAWRAKPAAPGASMQGGAK